MPSVGIVVLTMYAGDEQLFGALEAGASAFVPKKRAFRRGRRRRPARRLGPDRFHRVRPRRAMKRRLAPTGPQLSPAKARCCSCWRTA